MSMSEVCRRSSTHPFLYAKWGQHLNCLLHFIITINFLFHLLWNTQFRQGGVHNVIKLPIQVQENTILKLLLRLGFERRVLSAGQNWLQTFALRHQLTPSCLVSVWSTPTEDKLEPIMTIVFSGRKQKIRQADWWFSCLYYGKYIQEGSK